LSPSSRLRNKTSSALCSSPSALDPRPSAAEAFGSVPRGITHDSQTHHRCTDSCGTLSAPRSLASVTIARMARGRKGISARRRSSDCVGLRAERGVEKRRFRRGILIGRSCGKTGSFSLRQPRRPLSGSADDSGGTPECLLPRWPGGLCGFNRSAWCARGPRPPPHAVSGPARTERQQFLLLTLFWCTGADVRLCEARSARSRGCRHWPGNGVASLRYWRFRGGCFVEAIVGMASSWAGVILMAAAVLNMLGSERRPQIEHAVGHGCGSCLALWWVHSVLSPAVGTGAIRRPDAPPRCCALVRHAVCCDSRRSPGCIAHRLDTPCTWASLVVCVDCDSGRSSGSGRCCARRNTKEPNATRMTHRPRSPTASAVVAHFGPGVACVDFEGRVQMASE